VDFLKAALVIQKRQNVVNCSLEQCFGLYKVYATTWHFRMLIEHKFLCKISFLMFSKHNLLNKLTVERYGSCHSGEIRMDSMSRHQASFNKPVSFYIQMFWRSGNKLSCLVWLILLLGVSWLNTSCWGV